VVKTCTKGVFVNVHIDRKEFPTFIKLTKTFSNRSLAVPKRFDFRSGQDYARCVFVEKLVFKACALVLYVYLFLHAAKIVLICARRGIGISKYKTVFYKVHYYFLISAEASLQQFFAQRIQELLLQYPFYGTSSILRIKT